MIKLPNTTKGFTLIELMVAIAIVAILATVGLVVYSNTQIQARNSRRIQDIAAVASAFESAKQPGQAYYSAVATTSFAGNVLPDDPKSNLRHYCLYYKTISPPPTVPSITIPDISGWNTTTCPDLSDPVNINKQVFSATNLPTVAPFATVWSICAYLEGSTPTYQCLTNKQ